MKKDRLSTIYIDFWRRILCTTLHIIKLFLQHFFLYQTLLKLFGAFNLQLLY